MEQIRASTVQQKRELKPNPKENEDVWTTKGR